MAEEVEKDNNQVEDNIICHHSSSTTGEGQGVVPQVGKVHTEYVSQLGLEVGIG